MKIARAALTLSIAAAALAVVIGSASHEGKWPGVNLLFNGWGVTPQGSHTLVGDMAFKLVASPDGKEIVTTSQGFKGAHLTILDASTHNVIQDVKLKRTWNGVAFSSDGKALYVGGGNDEKILEFAYDHGKVSLSAQVDTGKGSFVAGIAVAPNGMLYACDEAHHEVLVIDPVGAKITAHIPTLRNPHTAVFGSDSRYLYVSAWGSQAVCVIDTTTQKVVREINVGVRPNDMALAPDGRLFVSCAGDNTVYVIQTRSLEAPVPGTDQAKRPPEGTREILNTALEPTVLEGSSPVGVSVSEDGKTLYVANSGNNDLMVADISDPSQTKVKGFVPTGWYPTSVLEKGGQLIVAVGKGLSSVTNVPKGDPTPDSSRPGLKYTYIGDTLQGFVSFLPVPDANALKSDTDLVRANTPFQVANVDKAGDVPGSVIPDHVGGISPIKHVLYVIMENRTYDQVFGDMPEGNGDPKLCMYGEKVTPNRHQLARDYVLFDNLYCSGEVSVDGHSWCDAAIATDANERQWTSGYSSHGDVTGSDNTQLAAGGYLWESARKAGLTVKDYGEASAEYFGGHAITSDGRGTWPGGRDKDRVSGFIGDLHKAEDTGKFPNFMIMSLGEDHTSGTRPGSYTPDASVGSNDQGIGKIVEALSHSKFWDSTAVFFIEDDAQNGPDHVDAHRTFGLVVSPYVKRHFVDHTMYSNVSFVRTIELILGLRPMTQFDAAATPLFNAFQTQAKVDNYNLVASTLDLDAKNTAKSPGAQASLKMDFREYDRAPADELNRILWAEAKGVDTPYPATRQSFVR